MCKFEYLRHEWFSSIPTVFFIAGCQLLPGYYQRNSNDFVERTRAHMHARTRLNLKTHSENETAHENNLVHFLANIFFTCIQHVYWMLCKMSADFFDRNFIRSLALATAHKWRNLDWECKWPCKCTRVFFLFRTMPFCTYIVFKLKSNEWFYGAAGTGVAIYEQIFVFRNKQ